MNAFKFETTIQEDGTIKIPEIKKFANQAVEVFIVEKANRFRKTQQINITFGEFSKKWRGFLRGAKIENWKNNYTTYLKEKYQ